MHPYRFNVHSFASVVAAKAMLVILARTFGIPRKAMRIETHVSEYAKEGTDEIKVTRYSTIVVVPEKLAPSILQNYAFGCNVFDTDACVDHLTRTLVNFTRGYVLGQSRTNANDGIEVVTVHHRAKIPTSDNVTAIRSAVG